MRFIIAAIVALVLASCQCQEKTADFADYAILPEPFTVTNYVTNTVTVTNYVTTKTSLVVATPAKKTKHGVVGVGGSVCGRVYVGHDWVDVVDLGPVGLGVGVYTTMNVADTKRFWDFGAKLNISY
jgi:hypothetical protein